MALQPEVRHSVHKLSYCGFSVHEQRECPLLTTMGTKLEKLRAAPSVLGKPSRPPLEALAHSYTLHWLHNYCHCLGSLKKPISMGYVPMGSQKAGTTVKVSVRNKISEATVTKMPFVEARYYKP